MGREIRKVPKGWQHPKDSRGNYKPLNNETYQSALEQYNAELKRWVTGEDPAAEKYSIPQTEQGFKEWRGSTKPDPEYYLPDDFPTDKADCFQMYETVSEGTPVSPVFKTLKGLEDWLVTQGYSRHAAAAFCENGWAPSMIFSPQSGLKMNIHTYDNGK